MTLQPGGIQSKEQAERLSAASNRHNVLSKLSCLEGQSQLLINPLGALAEARTGAVSTMIINRDAAAPCTSNTMESAV